MGFGFSLLFIFILLPLTLIFSLAGMTSGDRSWLKIPAVIWSSVALLMLVNAAVRPFFSKMELDEEEVYGHYIIDRSKFPGRQADWQYDHFRFEITSRREFLFHQTEEEKIIRTYKGRIAFAGGSHTSPRLLLQMDTPVHHVLKDNPTLYRETWSFYYVFRSPLFGNVFFTKGRWKPIR